MSKDNIRIHVGVDGAGESKRNIDTVARSTEEIGKTAQKSKGMFASAGEGIKKAISGLVGPLGIAAIGTAAVAAIGKAIAWFDKLKAKTDAAVTDVENLRQKYEELFEAVSAFDEKSRVNVTKNTALLLQETGVSEQLGIPIINEYTRQFRGQVDSGLLSQEDYDEGLKGMLGYGARHGGSSTKELIQMMKGWGMNTPDEQGQLRRMIASGAAQSGLTDSDMIEALARSGPTIQALGWTPERAIENVAILAAGESGRKKMSLPSTTIQALMAPQISDAGKLGFSDEAAGDPAKLYDAVKQRRDTMDQKDYVRMLTQLYGTEGAAGVYKLSSVPRGGIAGSLAIAAGVEGMQAEQAEEQQRMGTLEARSARANAVASWHKLDITEKEKYDKLIRQIGKAKKDQLERRQPIQEAWRAFTLVGDELENYDAAYLVWREGLSDEKRERYKSRDPLSGVDTSRAVWNAMSPKERFEEIDQQLPLPANTLTAPPLPRDRHAKPGIEVPTVPQEDHTMPAIEVPPEPQSQQGTSGPHSTNIYYNYHNHHETIFHPRIGSDGRGPRYRQESA